jgi:glycosyltransferase involved in cell wall biosynthesis
MKLCIVTPAVIKGDGQGRANYEIVQEALLRGHSVTIISRRLAPELQQYRQLKWIPIPVKEFPTEFLRDLIFSRRSSSWLKQHRHEFDLVQVYGCVTSASGDVNTVQFVHNAWLRSPFHISRMQRDFYGVYHLLYTALNAQWEKKAFQQAKVVVAVSNGVKRELISVGVQEHQIRVIYNGVDVQEFSPGYADRLQLGLPKDVALALFVGDIRVNRKNLDTVLHALVNVPELHLAVVGSIEGSPYPNLVTKLELNARVHFMGFRQNIPEIMRASDLLVFPSRYEPFGMVITEAMAVGLPVITTAVSGAAEIITPDCGVVLSNPEDSQALGKALTRLASDHDFRIQMGEAARLIAEQHTWISKAQTYVHLFEEMAAI